MFPPENLSEVRTEKVIDYYGTSDFMLSVCGKDSKKVWNIIDELMLTLKAVNPRLYDGVLNKISDI